MISKERMKAWKDLPSNCIPWETFKRLANQFGIEEAIKKAQKMIDKTTNVN